MGKPIIIYKNEKYQNPEEIIEYQIYYINKNNFINGISIQEVLDIYYENDEIFKLRVWEYGIIEADGYAYFDIIRSFYDDSVRIDSYHIDAYYYYSSDGKFEIDWLDYANLEDIYYIRQEKLINTPQEKLITLVYNKLKGE
jgi:hypothetical protein